MAHRGDSVHSVNVGMDRIARLFAQVRAHGRDPRGILSILSMPQACSREVLSIPLYGSGWPPALRNGAWSGRNAVLHAVTVRPTSPPAHRPMIDIQMTPTGGR